MSLLTPLDQKLSLVGCELKSIEIVHNGFALLPPAAVPQNSYLMMRFSTCDVKDQCTIDFVATKRLDAFIKVIKAITIIISDV